MDFLSLRRFINSKEFALASGFALCFNFPARLIECNNLLEAAEEMTRARNLACLHPRHLSLVGPGEQKQVRERCIYSATNFSPSE